jgi:hypothetical protein
MPAHHRAHCFVAKLLPNGIRPASRLARRRRQDQRHSRRPKVDTLPLECAAIARQPTIHQSKMRAIASRPYSDLCENHYATNRTDTE